MAFDYETRAGFIYFIQESVLRNIKIGFTSSHPASRLKVLANASSQELTLIGFMISDKPHEKRLHRRFNHLHVRNEWFQPGEDLLRFINGLEYGGEFERRLAQFVKAPGRR